MIDLKKFWHLNRKQITVTCTDGQVLTGKWIDWTSEQDNEPDPESITIAQADGFCTEIFVNEIESIQEARLVKRDKGDPEAPHK